MNRLVSRTAAVLVLGAACSAPAPGVPDEYPGDVLLAWNETVLAVAEAEDRLLTLKGLRTATMMHLAIHDALNSIEQRYECYLAARPSAGANPIAAAAQTAYEVAVDQYPNQERRFAEELGRWLGLVDDGASKAAGIALGTASATAILEVRSDDGWDTEAEYQWHPMGPGVYAEFREHSDTPEGFVFGAGWALARPFMLDRPSQFRAPPPPDIDSDSYTRAFNEVKELGRFESQSRTSDQTHLALWWKEFVESSHNRLARQLVAQEGLELWRSARLFALLNMSVFDAYVNVFDNKFFYNHWRPYTAIRWAANDGNPDTRPDLAWNNTHLHTYAFPSYPSAHGTACAAAMTALADTFGDDRQFTMTTESVDRAGPMSGKLTMNPPTRSFASFSEAAMECSLSRVYLGIHFRYDSLAGNTLGGRIGEYAARSFLLPPPASPAG